jgi:hypothetical protein
MMSYQAVTVGVVHTIERVRRSPLVPERDLTRHAPKQGERGPRGHPRCTQSVQSDYRSKDDVVKHFLGPEHNRTAHHRPGQCAVAKYSVVTLSLQTRQTLQIMQIMKYSSTEGRIVVCTETTV